MPTVQKLVLHNFMKFRDLTLTFDEHLNVFLGDNEAGKSSLLLALDLALGANRRRIESIGIETLFNQDVVREFLSGNKKSTDLPRLFVEVYLSPGSRFELNGKNNSSGIECDGVRLECAIPDDYSKEVSEVLADQQPNFPYEYYSVAFSTFAGEAYSGLRKYVRHLFIDSAQIGSEHAVREYTRTVFSCTTAGTERNRLENFYRYAKAEFCAARLRNVNDRLGEYKFAVRSDSRSNLLTDLQITEGNLPIESKGKGRQCFIKTAFALKKGHAEDGLDVLLLEEPENHLSHTNMKRLIEQIAQSADHRQLFLATHSSLVCARLDLRKAILLGQVAKPASLHNNRGGRSIVWMHDP